jgi:ubiquinone/menaquinone biosynthesis C-methylase UbiE
MSIKRHKEKLSFENMDYYYPLLQKRNLIENISKKYFSKTLIDLGCGEMPYKKIIEKYSKIENYIGIDIKNETYQRNLKPDIFWDGKKIPLGDGTIDCAMLIEVLEHVPDPKDVLQELNRVLVSGGVCLITVPFLWPLHDVPNDEYRYTPFALTKIAKETNFEIEIMESFGGWHASLASMIALYCRRGLTGNKFQNIISIILYPLVKYLMNKETKYPKNIFKESLMITGIWCLIRKR